MARSARQAAILAFVEQRAQAAPVAVADEHVAQECVEDVRQRWRTADPAAMGALRTVVHSVTRRVRCILRHESVPADIVASETTALATLEQQTIEEVTIVATEARGPPAQTDEDCWLAHPRLLELVRDRPDMFTALLQTGGEVAVQRTRAIEETKRAAKGEEEETKRRLAEEETKRKTTEEETKRKTAEMEEETKRLALQEETKRILGQRPPSVKRAAAQPLTDLELVEQSRRVFAGRCSLSAAVWDAKPDGVEVDAHTAYARLAAWVRDTTPGRAAVPRFRAWFATHAVEVLVVDGAVSLPAVAAAFWATVAPGDGGGPSGLAVAAVPNPAAPAGRSHHVVTPPDGVTDLLAALGLDAVGRAAALARLTDEFVPTTRGEWPMLWPPMPRCVARSALWTHLDTARDPVVGQLREAIAAGAAVPLPVYPAVGALDLRPVEAVPHELQTISPDVWPGMVATAPGLARACSRIIVLYGQSAGVPVRAAGAPHDERLRQWRRVTRDGTVAELSYRVIGECLGWFAADGTQARHQDTCLVKAIVAALLRSRATAPLKDDAAWYNNGASPVLWRWAACLWEMRLATVFVARLRLAGADVRHLAMDIERYA
jgi:hypothetical protein